MTIYQLHIMHGSHKEIITLTEGQTVHITAQPDTQYFIIDEQGNTPTDIIEKRTAQDLNIYIGTGNKPDLIIYDYNVYYPSSPEILVTDNIVASEVGKIIATPLF